jgi:hypothetical protein
MVLFFLRDSMWSLARRNLIMDYFKCLLFDESLELTFHPQCE